MPIASESGYVYLPRFLPYETGEGQVPMVTQLDTVTMKPKTMEPKAPSQINVDVSEIPAITTTSSTITTKIVWIGIGLTCLVVIAVGVAVGVTQGLKNTQADTTTTTTGTTGTTTTATTATTTTATTATTTSSSSTSTTTTRAPQYMRITGSNDTVVGIYNTSAGTSSGSSIGNYPVSENPPNAFDSNTGTKYLNSGIGVTSATAGVNTGLYVTPYIGSSIATGIWFATANDSPNRDPITITVEGSNNASTQLPYGSSWTLIYSGATGISSSVDPGRLTYVARQNFSNTIAYTSYRLLVTSQRGSDCCVQYSEANIYGIA